MEGPLTMKGENVLIIDGEEHSTCVFSELMERLGWRFTVATAPQEAEKHLRKGPWTVVIAGTSLFQPVQIATAQGLNPDISFIFTGHSLEEFVGHFKPGMSDFLSKPFGIEEAEFRLNRIVLERDAHLRYQEGERALQKARDELKRKSRELEASMEDLDRIKRLYKEIGNELDTTSEKLREANNRLELLAITDGLTEVFNHRYFMDQMYEKLAEGKKWSTPLSLLMIDIDHFKAFNDNHGHMTGDLVLKKIGHVLKSSSRREDVVARYGGEEFAIILPDTDRHEAQGIAETIRATVENDHLPDGEETRRVTVSIGVSTTGKDIDTVDGLISSADKALYRAKAQGRNRVVWGGKSQPTGFVQWFSRF